MKELIGKLNYGNRGPAGPAGPQGPKGDPGSAGDYTAGDGIEISESDVISCVGKLDESKCTYQTTEPTSDIYDGGVHIVYLQSEPSTKYDGYIYLIAE